MFNVITVSSSSLSGVGPSEVMLRVIPLDKVSLVDTDSSVSYFAKKNGQQKFILWYKCYLIDTLQTSTVKSTEL